MSIRLGSNIAALMAARRLDQSSQELFVSLERLSSGMRINRASDDAAGLSIASSLNADSRVFTQALRNINDGQSALSIAQSGVQQLSDILVRLRELATSASNGVFGRTQRITMDNEADLLVKEYNRITGSALFNGMSLLNGSARQLGIQVGYGSSGSINVGTGNDLSRNIGTGSFNTAQTYSTDGFAVATTLADINGDGKLDLISASQSQNLITRLGVGDGTFGAAVTAVIGENSNAIASGDFDGDGDLDIAVSTNTTMRIMRNNGGSNPTFTLAATLANGGNTIFVKDLNGDGRQDIITGSGDTGTSSLSIFMGNGNATFQSATTITGLSFADVKVTDMNRDGKQDIVALSCGSSFPGDARINIYFGNGNGTFQSRRSYYFADSIGGKHSFDIGDINHDGNLDVVAGTGYQYGYAVMLGNADGSLQRSTSFTSSYAVHLATLSDMNNDGFLDLILGSAAEHTIQILIGNGDGTFRLQNTYLNLSNLSDMSTGDLNSDGVIDIVAMNNAPTSSFSVYLAQTNTTTTSQRLDLTTQQSALDSLSIIEAAFNRVSAELGRIGANQSRLNFAHGAIYAARENYYAAYGRIIDVDVAEESAKLIRRQILQQAGAAVLAQASLQPSLALLLLKP